MLICVTGIWWNTLRRQLRRRQSQLQFPSCSLCQCPLWVGGCPVEVEKVEVEKVEVVEVEGEVEGNSVKADLKKGGGCLANVG